MKAQSYRMEDNFHLMEIFLTIFLFITPWRMEISTLNKYNLSYYPRTLYYLFSDFGTRKKNPMNISEFYQVVKYDKIIELFL